MKFNTLAALVVAVICGVLGAGGCGVLPPSGGSCSDCDDGNPCTVDTCSAGECSRKAVTPGDACLAETGFCDSDGVCRESCPIEPCLDAEVVPGFGCVYKVRPDGWTCVDGFDGGLCKEGVCVVPPTDVCSAEQEGDITNMLDGTCWWEQCHEGEKRLVQKIPGVPCVYRPAGTSEWTIGACDANAVCTGGFIPGLK